MYLLLNYIRKIINAILHNYKKFNVLESAPSYSSPSVSPSLSVSPGGKCKLFRPYCLDDPVDRKPVLPGKLIHPYCLDDPVDRRPVLPGKLIHPYRMDDPIDRKPVLPGMIT